MLKDRQGLDVSGASERGLERLEKAAELFLGYRGDPVAEVEAAIAESPSMPLGYALKAWLYLLGTEPGGLSPARAAFLAAIRLPATRREALHLRAIACLLDGRWHEAARVLSELSAEFPLDTLALQAGHQLDFFTGESRMLRDRIARALPAWDEKRPGYDAVLGMHAFGLEECGEYAAAEKAGRRAVALDPRNSWAQHAVAHVMEMQGRRTEGLAWMRADPAAWSTDSFFAVHNWWHVALFHLGQGEVAEVLELYDRHIDPRGSVVLLEMVDASAMLWRLMLRGVDTSGRWESLAERWAPVAGAGNYAFNDLHAMMAFACTGRASLADEVLRAQRDAMQRGGDNALFTREVGHPASLAVRAFTEGRYEECARLLQPVIPIAWRFGGSHAQRSVLNLTRAEATRRVKLAA